MTTSDDAAMDMGFDAGGAPMEDYKEEAEYQSGAFEEYPSTTDNEKLKDVKMVYTANMDLQTLSFDQADSDISALVEEMGGYFEQRSISNRSSGYRYAEYTVRVPAEKFNDFCSQMGNLCHLVYKNESADNITESYYDTQSRLVTRARSSARNFFIRYTSFCHLISPKTPMKMGVMVLVSTSI